MGLQGDAEENVRMGDIVSAGLAEDAAITQHSDAVQDAEDAVRNHQTCLLQSSLPVHPLRPNSCSHNLHQSQPLLLLAFKAIMLSTKLHCH